MKADPAVTGPEATPESVGVSDRWRELLPCSLTWRSRILGVPSETGWVLGGPKGAPARLGLKRSTLQ